MPIIPTRYRGGRDIRRQHPSGGAQRTNQGAQDDPEYRLFEVRTLAGSVNKKGEPTFQVEIRNRIRSTKVRWIEHDSQQRGLDALLQGGKFGRGQNRVALTTRLAGRPPRSWRVPRSRSGSA